MNEGIISFTGSYSYDNITVFNTEGKWTFSPEIEMLLSANIVFPSDKLFIFGQISLIFMIKSKDLRAESYSLLTGVWHHKKKLMCQLLKTLPRLQEKWYGDTFIISTIFIRTWVASISPPPPPPRAVPAISSIFQQLSAQISLIWVIQMNILLLLLLLLLLIIIIIILC